MHIIKHTKYLKDVYKIPQKMQNSDNDHGYYFKYAIERSGKLLNYTLVSE